MLDRKVKDSDAGVELLMDRLKINKLFFFGFFIIGWIIAGVGVFFVSSKYDETVIGFGICMLIFATWYLMCMLNYSVLIKIEKKMGGK